MGILNKLKNAVNAFREDEKLPNRYRELGYSTTYYPDRSYYTNNNDKSIISVIYNRIAVDVASIMFRHIIVDENNRYIKEVQDDLNNCLTVEANKDQTARSFIQDIIETMFNHGYVAILPVDTDKGLSDEGLSFKIYTMRVGIIKEWFPNHVMIEAYNDNKGIKQNIIVAKSEVAIIENPFYAIMNEPNSVAKRLIRKLNLMDVIDEQVGSNKLDLIIQLPYIVKTETRRQQAENRRKDIEEQLAGSKYGIAYTDGTEKITQLNRPVENNMLASVQYLTSMLYSQLGITESVLNGTAKPEEMQNYLTRTVEPCASAIVDEFNRKFLSKTARTQMHRIAYFNNPFKLIPVDKIADIADKFTRNEILSSNEVRQIIGMKPVNDPKADQLLNKNMPVQDQQQATPEGGASEEDLAVLNEQITQLEKLVDGGENQNGQKGL